MPDKAVADRMERVRVLHNSLHIPEVHAPKRETVEYPESLADLSPEQLSDHLTYWSGLAAYTQVQVAAFEGAATIARAEFEVAFDVRYFHSTFTAVTDKRHTTGALETVQAAKFKAAKLEADAKILKALLYSYETRYNAVSREITRRRGELDRLGG